MARRRPLLAALAVAALALATTQSSAEEPVDTVRRLAQNALGGVGGPGGPGGGGGGFPPAGFVTTSISWTMNAGDVAPTFTPPNPATSHPANWSCTTSTTATTAHASCTPTDPYDPGTVGWACYDPFVVVDVDSGNASPDSVTGSAHCGDTVATCTATTGIGFSTGTIAVGSGTPIAHCQQAAFPHQPVPLNCHAEFSRAKPTATWTVRCAPVDP